MRVPFLTTWLTAPRSEDRTPERAYPPHLERRKGGGGKGGGGGGSGGKGGSGGSSGGSSGGGGGRSVPVSGAGAGTGGRTSASTYGNGGGRTSRLPSGAPFAGRDVGGGTRQQVYGSRTYGSGYPGYNGYNNAGRGFPFYFWPMAWGGAAGAGGAYYLHNNEYGRPDNSSRPGGPVRQLTFASPKVNNTFHVLADNTTASALLDEIYSRCQANFNTSAPTTPSGGAPAAYNDSDATAPGPGSAVQYYRASSVVLTLDQYNNTAALGDNVTDATGDVYSVPLPAQLDQDLLTCLNGTIGDAVPLFDSAAAPRQIGAGGATAGSVALLWVLWHVLTDAI